MNRLVLIALLIVGIAGTWFFISSNGQNLPEKKIEIAGVTKNGSAAVNNNADQHAAVDQKNPANTQESTDEDSQGVTDAEDRPATDLYKTADEALKAVKDGATRYDDVVLQQFTQLGPDCTWCSAFYGTVRDMLKDNTLPTDQRSYYAELLAVSGRVDNVEQLVNAVESAPEGEGKNLYSEALELVVGKDDVVNYLGSRLTAAPNPELKESLAAAISNQGSALAVDTLYKSCVESGNPDCFYSAGTGLGEVIPDEEAFPSLQQIIAKRDDYSANGVRALMNAGVEGVKRVFETLATTNDVARDQKILKDSVEHINYDEDTEAYLKDIQTKTKNPALAELAKNALESFAKEESDNAAGDGTDDQTDQAATE
jgi:hypothetical protein